MAQAGIAVGQVSLIDRTTAAAGMGRCPQQLAEFGIMILEELIQSGAMPVKTTI
jgi:hypothetical protein